MTLVHGPAAGKARSASVDRHVARTIRLADSTLATGQKIAQCWSV